MSSLERKIATTLTATVLVLVCGCGARESQMPETDFSCTSCQAVIPPEKPYHSLTLAREKRDPDGINVVEAVALVQFCEQCAVDHDLESGIKVYSIASGQLMPLDDMEHVHADNCWDCGARLGDDPYFSLVHYHEKLTPELEIEVIEAVDVLYLCPGCRRKYDFDRLELESSG